jgi:phage baseplate assembly protein gpV
MKISALDPLISDFTPTVDYLPVVHAGKTWKIAASDVATAVVGGPYLPLTGGVLSGPLTIQSAVNAKLTLTGTGGDWPGVIWNMPPGTAALFESHRIVSGTPRTRWSVEFGGTQAETGNNVGTDFLINRFDDGGNVLYPSPLGINRASGGVTIGTALMLSGDPTAPLMAATRQYVDNNFTPLAGGGYVAKTGDVMSGVLHMNAGLDFGARFAMGPTDTSQHIALYGGWGGLNITSGALNVVAGGNVAMTFNGAAVSVGGGQSLFLDHDPTNLTEAVTKRYVDQNFSPITGGGYVRKIGDTMTGGLVIDMTADMNTETIPLTVVAGDYPEIHLRGVGDGWPAIVGDAQMGRASLYLVANRNGLARWGMEFATSENEDGGNTGSNFGVRPMGDDGLSLPMLFGLRRVGDGWIDGPFSIGWGAKNFLTIAPGASNSATIDLFASGSGAIQFHPNVLLNADPTTDSQAATKHYVDTNSITSAAGDARWVNVGGDTMTGPLGIADTSSSPLVILGNPVMPGIPPPAPSVRFIGAHNNDGMFLVDAFGNGGSGGGGFFMARSTGGDAGAVTVGQRMGGLRFSGYGTTGYGTARAIIQAFAAETFTDDTQGVYFSFLTTAIGTATPLERLRLTDAGALLLQVGDPTVPLQAATKNYVDGALVRAGGPFLPLTAGVGNPLSGMLYLPTTLPTLDQEATNKLYVDTEIDLLLTKIGALAQNLVFVGQIDIPADRTLFTAASGINPPPPAVAVPMALPPASSLPKGFYVIVTVPGQPPPGSNIPPGDYVRSDWLVTDSTQWIWLQLGLVYFTAAEVETLPPIEGTTHVQQTLEWLNANKLNIDGGAMAGFLTLYADPTAPLHAATRQYVDGTITQVGDARYVNVTGDTMIGPLTIQGNLLVSPGSLSVSYDATFGFNGAGYAAIYMNAGPATNRITYYMTNGVTRWLYGTGAGAESGGNTGSDFFLSAYADNGGAIWTALQFSRATGLGTLAGDPTDPLGIATKRYVDNNTISAGAGDARWVNVGGDVMSGLLEIRAPDTPTTAQFVLRPTATGAVRLESKIRFYGSFDYAGDTTPRFAASIRGGFQGGAWGSEHLDIWISNQTNDADTDAYQSRIARFQLGLVTIDRDLIVTGHTGFRTGIDFNPNVVTTPTDLSKHIDLYAGAYGFSVSNDGALNHASGGSHNFYVSAGASVATFASTLATIRTDLTVTNNLTVNGATSVKRFIFSENNNGVVPVEGGYGALSWNATAGQGEVDFINAWSNFGGFRFLQVTGPGAWRTVLDIRPDGNMTTSGLGIAYPGVAGGGNTMAFTWANSAVNAFVDGNAVGALARKSELTDYLPLSTGGTVTGHTTFSGANPQISLNSTTGDYRSLSFETNGLWRWHFTVTAGESTGNVGSDFTVSRMGDNGSPIDAPLRIARNSGRMYLQSGNDPIEILSPAGTGARYRSTINGLRTWSAGTWTDGSYSIGDETAAAFRLTIDTSGNTTLNGGLTVAARSTFNGVYMNNHVAASATDLSQGIDMYGGSYGFSITGGTLNIIAGGQTQFYPNGGYVAAMHGGGLWFATGMTATLGRDPTAAMDAATKQYVDAHVATGGPFLPLTGGTLTGPLAFTDAAAAGTDTRTFDFRTLNGVFSGRLANNAYTQFTNWLDVHRYPSGGMLIQSINLNGPVLAPVFQGGSATISATGPGSIAGSTGLLIADSMMNTSGWFGVHSDNAYFMERNPGSGAWRWVENSVEHMSLSASGALTVSQDITSSGGYVRANGGALVAHAPTNGYPQLQLNNTGGGADQNNFMLFVAPNGSLNMQFNNDTVSAGNVFFSATRTGYAPAAVTLIAPTITLNGAVTTQGAIMNTGGVMYVGGNYNYYMGRDNADGRWKIVDNNNVRFNMDAAGNLVVATSVRSGAVYFDSGNFHAYGDATYRHFVWETQWEEYWNISNGQRGYGIPGATQVIYEVVAPNAYIIFNWIKQWAGVGAYWDVSDERLKRDVESYDDDGLAAILKVRPIRFRRHRPPNVPVPFASDETPELGFSAQQLREAIPDAVHDTVPNPNAPPELQGVPLLAISTTPVIAALVNAIKTLHARIETLEKRTLH